MTGITRKALGLSGLFLIFYTMGAAAFEPVDGIITGIDASGMVTAKQTAGGRTFQFKVSDQALLQSLHIGQTIHADFGANIVAVHGLTPCCGIVAGAATGAPRLNLGMHDYEVDGVQVALLGVKRDNPTQITVRWRYRNTAAEPRTIGESFGGMGSSEAYSLEWDAYVVDPVKRVKYTILKDAHGIPVAAHHGGGKAVTLRANQSLSVWAEFPLPAQVAKVSVHIPGTEPFENVTVAHLDPPSGAR